MADIPPSHEVRWRIAHAHVTSWREWEGEMVIYDDQSGDTLKLDVIMSVVFNLLKSSPATSVELAEQLANMLDLENDPKLFQLTELALHRLVGSGVVERVPNSPLKQA